MKAIFNKTAGIITVSDLGFKTRLEIRDITGKILRSFYAITPPFTMDSDSFINGEYQLMAYSIDGNQSVKISITH